MYTIPGIHHITGITTDVQKNANFYEGFLGQRMVKKTVNFDDPSAYHLYYGDYIGTPGTILTFFYWPQLPKGTAGTGEVSSIAYRICPKSFPYWANRAHECNVPVRETTTAFGEACLEFSDPDGLMVVLVVNQEAEAITGLKEWFESPVPQEHQLRGFYGVTIQVHEAVDLLPMMIRALGYQPLIASGSYHRLVTGNLINQSYVDISVRVDLPAARQGGGSIHHLAFQAATEPDRAVVQTQIEALGIPTTGLVNRFYFHATYAITPAQVLFEIATNDIGFTLDQAPEDLGEKFIVPAALESHREEIIASLVPFTLPRHTPKITKAI